MGLEELYEKVGGSYQEAINRMMTESLVKRLLKKFLEDQEFENLEKAMAEGNAHAAFVAAHTLKGVALNLELGNLSRVVSELTEALRNGKTPEADPLFEKLKPVYAETIEVLRSLE